MFLGGNWPRPSGNTGYNPILHMQCSSYNPYAQATRFSLALSLSVRTGKDVGRTFFLPRTGSKPASFVQRRRGSAQRAAQSGSSCRSACRQSRRTLMARANWQRPEPLENKVTPHFRITQQNGSGEAEVEKRLAEASVRGNTANKCSMLGNSNYIKICYIYRQLIMSFY